MSVEMPPPADLQKADVPMLAPQLDAVRDEIDPPGPRLSILHLMVWTGLIAAMIGLFRGLRMLSPFSPAAEEMIALSIVATYCGTALGGLVLLVARRFRGMRFPTEPGEWLLVVQGGIVLCVLLAMGPLILAAAKRNEPMSDGIAIPVITFLVTAISAIALLPVFCFRETGPWPLAFKAFAALCVMPALIFGQAYLSESFALAVIWAAMAVFLAIVAGTLLLVSAALDSLWRIPRGWVHWTGIAALFGLVCTMVIL